MAVKATPMIKTVARIRDIERLLRHPSQTNTATRQSAREELERLSMQVDRICLMLDQVYFRSVRDTLPPAPIEGNLR
jgi:hypothetical protein